MRADYQGVIAGALVRRGEPAEIPGSVELQCNRCKAPTWLAPTGQQLMATKYLELLCVPCALKDAEAKGKKFETPTQAQQAEVVAELRRRSGDRR